MTTMDVKDAMFHFASNPRRSTDQYMTIVFDSGDADPPSFEDVVAHVEQRAPFVPRLQIRISEARGQLEYPRWVRDVRPIRDHLIDHDLSGGRHTLESFLADLCSVPIDATDSAWAVHVGRGLSEVDGVQGTATVVVVHLSHAMSDGSVGTRIADALFGHSPITGTVDLPDDPEASRPRPVFDAVKAVLLLPTRWARSRVRMVLAQRRYLAAVKTGQVVAPGPAEATRINTHPDGTRVVHVLQFPKAQWTGGSTTVTVTALTAVGAALRDYFAAHGDSTPEQIRALVPTAIEQAEQWPAINRTLPTSVPFHVDLPDTTERASAISTSLADQLTHVGDHRHIDAIRSAEGYPAALLFGFGRLARLTAPRTGRPARVTSHCTVTSVNRTGVKLQLCASTARFSVSIASLGPGRSLSHAVCGYGDVVTVGVSVCPTTFPDHADYVEILRASIEGTCADLHGRRVTEARR